MAELNRTARDIMVKYPVHSCTDVTGFGLLGHGYEMASGSGCTLHINTGSVPYIKEAYEFAEMGVIPAGAYRNREYAEPGVAIRGSVTRAMQDILYDPQTSGGLLIAVAESSAPALLRELRDSIPVASEIGYVTDLQESSVILH